VSDLLTTCHAWGERKRRLNQLLLVYYVISFSLFHRLNLAAVLAHLVRGLRWLWSNSSLRLPTSAALVYRRRQLGTPVMRHLFQSVCQPMAKEQTRGTFRFGLRLMAIDGTLDEVAETQANALYFGPLSSGKNQMIIEDYLKYIQAEALAYERRSTTRSSAWRTRQLPLW